VKKTSLLNARNRMWTRCHLWIFIAVIILLIHRKIRIINKGRNPEVIKIFLLKNGN
jgi:hypothetical protein